MDIFLSYSHTDREWARRLADALASEGWSVFWDWAVPSGHRWRQVIAEQLQAADCVVVLWSASSVGSSWVIEEADFGRERGILIPVLIDAVTPPLGFREIHAHHMAGWRSDARDADFRKLVTDISAVLDPESDHRHGPARPGSSEPTEGPRHKGTRPARLGSLLPISGLLVAFGIIGASTHLTRESKPAPAPLEASVAVLPFANLNHDPSQEYFSDGLTDTIIGRLSKVRGLKVAARTSSFRFKDRSDSLSDIGRQLNVATVLEGSVQLSNKRLRVFAALVRTTDGSQMWAEQFDTELSDVFEVHDKISNAVTEQLRVTLLQGDVPRTRETNSLEAYDNYLLGRHHSHKRTDASLRRAVGFFKEAIRLDPGFPLAYSGLADAYLFLNEFAAPANHEALANLDAAEAAVHTALSLDSQLAEARASLGLLKDYDADDTAEDEFRNALALNPNYVSAHLWFGDFLKARGRLRDALASYEKVLDLDPLSYIASYQVGEIHRLLGNFDGAQPHYERAIRLEPDFPHAYFSLARSYWARGRLAETYHWFGVGIEHAPSDVVELANFAIVHVELGYFDHAHELLRRAEDDAFHPRLAHAAGILYISQGQYERARAFSEDAAHRYPHFGGSLLLAGATELLLGNVERAIEYYDMANLRFEASQEALFAEPGELTISLAHALIRAKAHADAGLHQVADQLIRNVEALLERGAGEYHVVDMPYHRAAIHALRGEVPEALESLQRAVAQGWRRSWELIHNPVFADLRTHPETDRLYGQLERLIAEARTAISTSPTAVPLGATDPTWLRWAPLQASDQRPDPMKHEVAP